MNDRELEQLLDDAAADFTPTPDVGRLSGMLHQRHRLTRPIVYGLSIAAALAISVGGAAAMTGGDDTARVVPADLVELPTTSASTTTVAASTTTTTTTTTTVATTVPPTIEPIVSVEALVPEQPVAEPETPTPTEPPAAEPSPPPPPTAAPATQPPPPPPPATPAPAAPPTTHAPEPTAPPTTHAPETTSPPMGFSAVQTWGSCSSTPPYEEFSGTAAAGSTINVTSPHGSGSTTADGGGHWYIQVFFPSAPPNQQFTITVSSAQGSASFPFVHTV